jgi:hypothetical protein
MKVLYSIISLYFTHKDMIDEEVKIYLDMDN